MVVKKQKKKTTLTEDNKIQTHLPVSFINIVSMRYSGAYQYSTSLCTGGIKPIAV